MTVISRFPPPSPHHVGGKKLVFAAPYKFSPPISFFKILTPCILRYKAHKSSSQNKFPHNQNYLERHTKQIFLIIYYLFVEYTPSFITSDSICFTFFSFFSQKIQLHSSIPVNQPRGPVGKKKARQKKDCIIFSRFIIINGGSSATMCAHTQPLPAVCTSRSVCVDVS